MTVTFGAVCLFVPVRALTRAAPARDLAGSAPDLLDLAWQVACWAARRSTYTSKLVRFAEHAAGTRRIGTVITWVNPRVHQSNAVALVSLTSGALLALTQVLLEQSVSDSGHLWMVVALFVGLEAFAVALGYAMLADVLVLFRNEGRPRRGLAS